MIQTDLLEKVVYFIGVSLKALFAPREQAVKVVFDT